MISMNKQTSAEQIKQYLFDKKYRVYEKMPLSEIHFHDIASKTHTLAGCFFVISKQPLPRAIVLPFEIAVFESLSLDGKENSNIGAYDSLIANVITQVTKTLGVNFVKARNISEQSKASSDATISDCKPDLLLISKYTTYVWGEEKSEELFEAEKDIIKKIGSMSDRFYGQVPCVFAYAACKSRVSVYCIMRVTSTAVLLREFDLTNIEERIELVILSIQIAVLLVKFDRVLAATDKFPYQRGIWIDRIKNVQIKFDMHANFVLKKVRFNNTDGGYPYASQQDLDKIYDIIIETTKSRPKNVPMHIIRCSKKETTERNTMTITLSPFCYTRRISTFSELVKCFHHLSSGLLFLHTKRIVHRDLRWANVLYDCNNEEYLLHDFEHSAVLDTEESFTRVTRDFKTNLEVAGLEIMPDRSYKYDIKSDLYAFGMMMKLALESSSAPIRLHMIEIGQLDDSPDLFRRVNEIVECLIHRTPAERINTRQLNTRLVGFFFNVLLCLILI